MRKKLYNTAALVFFLCMFYVYVKITGTYAIQTKEAKDIKEVGMEVTDILILHYREKIMENTDRPIVMEGIVKGETYGQGVAVYESSPYHIPLDEIAEMIEHAYAYSNIWEDIAGKEFDGLGYLPEGEKIPITVYLAGGNEILFLPKRFTDKKVWINHELCRMHYAESSGNYLFFHIRQFGKEEMGVPVDSADSRYQIGIYTIRKDIEDMSSLVKLGETEVTFGPKMKAEVPVVPIIQNEYIDAAVKEAQCILAGRETYGEFKMYIGQYERDFTEYTDSTGCRITGCITGNGMEQYFSAAVSDNGGIRPAYQRNGDPDYYISDGEMYQDDIRRIMELERAVVTFSVEEGRDYADYFKNQEYDTEYDQGNVIEFRGMGLEEAAEFVNDMYSYSECFGLHELGCMAGGVRGLVHKEVILYAYYGGLLFVPKEEINYIVQDEDGKDYRFHINGGVLQFYEISNSAVKRRSGQLGTSLIQRINFGTRVMGPKSRIDMAVEELTEIGEITVEITDHLENIFPKLEKDEFIQATEDYIRDLLVQGGKSGEYRMYIGEYTAGSDANKACISGKYYFWPTGFGLDGSLEECAADRHYMNRLCIERTKQLERSEFEITVP